MLLLGIPEYIEYGNKNVVKYRNVESEEWFYIYMDIETINLLLRNYGVISTKQIPSVYRCCDNPTTGKTVRLNYCGAKLQIECGNDSKFYLPVLEQNY